MKLIKLLTTNNVFKKLLTTNNVFKIGLGLMIISGGVVCIVSSPQKRMETIENFFKVATLPTTIIFGVNQIKEKRESELRLAIAAEFKDFNNRKETVNVRKMLEKEIHVIELFPDAKDHKDRILNVEPIRYKEALESVKKLPEIQGDDDFRCKNNPAYIEAAIRDNLDSFFTDLEQIQLMAQSRAIPYEYIQNYMEPWKRMFKAANERTEKKLENYVLRQEYYNVLELFYPEKDIKKLREEQKHQEIDTHPEVSLSAIWLS